MNIPLRKFLLLAVNNFEGWIVVDKEIACAILADDPKQELVHYEEIEGKLWRRSDWDMLQAQQQVKYKNWSERKAIWDKLERNMKLLSGAIMRQTGVDMDTAKQIASKIIQKTPHRAKSNFDVTLEP